ncbi:MAG: 5-formyltetrahydrofolate cyclo-ligase [Flavobacteriaceae bacterium]
MNKKQIRDHYKVKRMQLSAHERNSMGHAIANHAMSLPVWGKTYFHLYLSSLKQAEVETEPLLTLLQGKDKEVVVPRMEKDRQLSHVLLTDSTLIQINTWGIPEPQGGLAIDPEKLEVVFVPLLAYDERGNRLGYGKGYYDRFLAQCRQDCVKIGLSFFPPEKEIPIEKTDIPLDFCITPTQVYTFG